MSKYLKFVIVALVLLIGGFLLLSFVGSSLISEVNTEIKIERDEDIVDAKTGKPAPYFELPDLNEVKVKSADFLGKPAVFVFWASWNSESADQIKILDDLVRNLVSGKKAELFEIITISSQEDKNAVLNFMKRGDYKAHTLLDESGEITEKYGARNLPAAYFLDKEGVIRDIFIGTLSEKMLVEKIERLLAQ